MLHTSARSYTQRYRELKNEAEREVQKISISQKKVSAVCVTSIVRYLMEKPAAFRARDPRATGGDRDRLGG